MFVKDLMCQAAFLSGRNTWWLSGYKSQWSCFRTVFSQTQKIKNVCLKRRFQFVGRKKPQIENPSPFAWKEFAYFSAAFSLSSALVSLRQKQDRPSLHSASKRPTLSFCYPCELISYSLRDPCSYPESASAHFSLN